MNGKHHIHMRSLSSSFVQNLTWGTRYVINNPADPATNKSRKHNFQFGKRISRLYKREQTCGMVCPWNYQASDIRSSLHVDFSLRRTRVTHIITCEQKYVMSTVVDLLTREGNVHISNPSRQKNYLRNAVASVQKIFQSPHFNLNENRECTFDD